jgi:hypothetical protein
MNMKLTERLEWTWAEMTNTWLDPGVVQKVVAPVDDG